MKGSVPHQSASSGRGGYTDDQMIAGTARHTGWDYIDKKLPHYVCVSTSQTLKAVETWLPMQSLKILKALLENLPIKWQERSQPLVLLWKKWQLSVGGGRSRQRSHWAQTLVY